MMRPWWLVLSGACLTGCAHPKPPPEPPQSAVAPDHVLGITLRRPVDRAALFGVRCFTGRQFATLDGSYDIVSDDILASATEEYQDTTAVLRALDSLTACITRTRALGANAIITVSDSVVGHVMAYWAEGSGPTYDSVMALLTKEFGAPYQNASGVRYWSADSMAIWITSRSMMGPGTAIDLIDARLCERYERLVHQNNTRDSHTYPCWTKPVRLDTAEIFTARPLALADSDLDIAQIPHRADSAEVLRMMGQPASRDGATWTYAGLKILLDSGRVNTIVLTNRQRATRRGLRVGDPAGRAKALYGTPCIREIWAYCRIVTQEPDSRGMMLEVKDHVITEIRLGTIFAQ